LTLGCSTPKSKISKVENYRDLASLAVDFSQEEFMLNDCFSNERNTCYEKNSYSDLDQGFLENDDEFKLRANNVYQKYESCIVETSMSCAVVNGREDLALNIQKNANERKVNHKNLKNMDWFFSSGKKIKQFYSFIKRLDKVRKKIKNNAKQFARKGKKITLASMHGLGAGIRLSAFALEGRVLSAEAMILNKEIAIYCAPGIVYNTDVGVEIGITRAFAKGCKNPPAYEGQFISVHGSISSETLGLPLSYEGAYSFGFDTLKIKRNLDKKRKENLFYPNLAFSEYLVLKEVLKIEIAKMNLSKMQKHALKLSTVLGIQMLMPFSGGVDYSDLISPMSAKLLYNSYKKSVGHEAKAILSSQSFQNVLIKYKLKNLKVFIDELTSALSGCDTISGALSLSASVSPVSVGVSVTTYSKLIAMDLDKLFTFRNVSALSMLNPLLLDTYALSKIIEFAVLLEDLPKTLSNKCYNDDYDSIIEAFSLYN
jgi:hypothetical protein